MQVAHFAGAHYTLKAGEHCLEEYANHGQALEGSVEREALERELQDVESMMKTHLGEVEHQAVVQQEAVAGYCGVPMMVGHVQGRIPLRAVVAAVEVVVVVAAAEAVVVVAAAVVVAVVVAAAEVAVVVVVAAAEAVAVAAAVPLHGVGLPTEQRGLPIPLQEIQMPPVNNTYTHQSNKKKQTRTPMWLRSNLSRFMGQYKKFLWWKSERHARMHTQRHRHTDTHTHARTHSYMNTTLPLALTLERIPALWPGAGYTLCPYCPCQACHCGPVPNWPHI